MRVSPLFLAPPPLLLALLSTAKIFRPVFFACHCRFTNQNSVNSMLKPLRSLMSFVRPYEAATWACRSGPFCSVVAMPLERVTKRSARQADVRRLEELWQSAQTTVQSRMTHYHTSATNPQPNAFFGWVLVVAAMKQLLGHSKQWPIDNLGSCIAHYYSNDEDYPLIGTTKTSSRTATTNSLQW